EPQDCLAIDGPKAFEQGSPVAVPDRLSVNVFDVAQEVEIVGPDGQQDADVLVAAGERKQKPGERAGKRVRRRGEQFLELIDDEQRRGLFRRQVTLKRERGLT